MFETSIAGSLPKPAWLAETNKLWPQWAAEGDALRQAKADATLLWIKAQEDAGLDIVCDGEQSRQHFVHGFLEQVEGIDFEHKVKMGIRDNRYDAMVPQVVSALRLKGRVHAFEAQLARAHTKKKLKFTLPGPMTIVDTVADRFYGGNAEGRIKMAFAFAELLNQEALALQADGVDIIQFDEPAFNVYMKDAADWGVQADVWSCPSFNELTREGQDADRWNLLHPLETPRVPFVTRQLGSRSGPVVASTDYMKAYAEQIRPFVPKGRSYRVLGTDGFGRSDFRSKLREHFEINRHYIVVAALKALSEQGSVPVAKVAEAIAKYGIQADKINPLYA